MFYYPTVLQHRTGCFSTIWLAATKCTKIPRRDYLKVNVQRTCNDVMDYVMVRVPPLQPGLPRPRFSLYLSSQLQYGIVIIFHRQCVILLEEIQHTIDRLLRTGRQSRIDLEEPGRLALNLPDNLALLEEAEMAQDPFFGMMEYLLPSPSTLMQRLQAAEVVSPQRPLVRSPGTPHRDAITASPESITLKETEAVVIPEVEFEGVELPEVVPRHMEIIDILMEQEDHFPEGERQLRVTTLAGEDLVLLPEEEEAGLPIQVPVPAPVETTPVSMPPLPSPPEAVREEAEEEIEPEPEPEPAPRRRPRRRQLLFIDTQTQIPQDELQRMIQDPLTETQPLVLFEPHPRIPPAELLNNPCTPLHPDILSLWKRGAVITPLPSPVAIKRVREPEKESEGEEVSSKEVPRELAESELAQAEVSAAVPVPIEPMLEVSDRDVSQLVTPESRGMISEPLKERGEVSFDSLLPPLADRSTVASSFFSLLELVSTMKLTAQQEEPYGTITILPGPLYESEGE
ncbi:meiotic recombination protein REC8 homolog [Megalops cyprinoides]|uniref:meiotic recombination protein REC8 homolog n=1 Tax=Megalops cyprinoides TaxID=118141 RepID=UPI001864BED7|nr:meiotic recombination protein REC8 homolog [Megalops cyprinoides]